MGEAASQRPEHVSDLLGVGIRGFIGGPAALKEHDFSRKSRQAVFQN